MFLVLDIPYMNPSFTFSYLYMYIFKKGTLESSAVEKVVDDVFFMRIFVDQTVFSNRELLYIRVPMLTCQIA